MRVNLKIDGVYAGDNRTLREFALGRIQELFRDNADHINEVIINVDDRYQDGTVSERRCSVRLYIPGQLPVQVMKHGHNIYSAITRAVRTAAHRVRIRTRQRRQTLNLLGI